MTLDQIVARCQVRFRDSQSRTYTEAEWQAYVNDAYRDVLATRSDWPFTEARTSLNLAASAAEVALPADVFRVTAVHNTTDDVPLVQIDGRATYNDYFPSPDLSTGVPQFYRLRDTTIEVYPRPAVATVLSVDYFESPAELGASDEPVFPELWHHVLVFGALRYAYEDDGNPEASDRLQGRYDRLLGDLLAAQFSTRTDAYPQVVDTF